MGEQQSSRQDKDHIVITVSVKRVTFEPLATGSPARSVSTVMGQPAERRVVGDLLTFSATGSDVESAKKRATVMLGAIDDATPSTNLRHKAMRDSEDETR